MLQLETGLIGIINAYVDKVHMNTIIIADSLVCANVWDLKNVCKNH